MTADQRPRLLEPLTIGTGLWLDRFVGFVAPTAAVLALVGVLGWAWVDFDGAIHQLQLGFMPSSGFWVSLAAVAFVGLVASTAVQGGIIVTTARADRALDIPYTQVLRRLPVAVAVGLVLTIGCGLWTWVMAVVLSKASLAAYLAVTGVSMLVLVALTWTLLPAIFIGPAKPLEAIADGWRVAATNRVAVLASVGMLTVLHGVWTYASARVLVNTWPAESWRLVALTATMVVEIAVVTSFVTVASTALYLRHRPA